MKQPRPPENVRLVHEDGRTIPIECVYVGRTRPFEGGPRLHTWESTLIVEMTKAEAAAEWHAEIDRLPARSSVVLRFWEDPDGS